MVAGANSRRCRQRHRHFALATPDLTAYQARPGRAGQDQASPVRMAKLIYWPSRIRQIAAVCIIMSTHTHTHIRLVGQLIKYLYKLQAGWQHLLPVQVGRQSQPGFRVAAAAAEAGGFLLLARSCQYFWTWSQFVYLSGIFDHNKRTQSGRRGRGTG